jgi:hypothetical protein
LIRFTQREEHETTEEELGPSEAREEVKVDDAAVGIALLAKVADRQCQGVSHSVIHNLQELKWLVAIFWSLFLMDIIGDQVGWKGAIWIIVLLVALCIAIQLWEFHSAAQMERRSAVSWEPSWEYWMAWSSVEHSDIPSTETSGYPWVASMAALTAYLSVDPTGGYLAGLKASH